MKVWTPDQERIAPLRLTVGMKGFMRLQCWRPDPILSRCRIDTGWFPNKILDAGRNQMPQRDDWMTKCQVGTNNTAPLATDTGLLGYVAGTSTLQADNWGAQGSAPYYGWRQKTFRFGVGAGHGAQNLKEAGVGWATSGAALVSRALIVDPFTQLPTVVTPLVDEILDVSYLLRYYPPLVDVSQSVTLNGLNYDALTRAAEVTNSTAWGSYIGRQLGEVSLFSSDWSAFDGNIGTLTQSPSGLSAACDHANAFNEAYSNNSYQLSMQCNTGSTGWNLAAGIRSLRMKCTAGYYQTQFNRNPGSQTVPKDINFTMDMAWTLAWVEA